MTKSKNNSEENVQNRSKNMGGFFEEAINLITNPYKKKKDSLGFPSIDEILKYLQSGSLVTLSGVQNIGKTALFLDFTINLLEQGKKVLFFTNRDSALLVAQKTFIQKLKIPIHILSQETLEENLTDTEKEKRQKEKKFFKNSNFLIIDDYNLSVDKIVSESTCFEPDYIFIDNIQGLNQEVSIHRDKFLNSEIIKLNRFIKEREITTFVIAGMHSYGIKCPKISDIEGLLELKKCSEVIILLELLWDEEKDEHGYNLIIDKNKFGICGEIKIHKAQDCGYFEEPEVRLLF